MAAFVGVLNWRPSAQADLAARETTTRTRKVDLATPAFAAVNETTSRYHFDITAPANSWAHLFFQLCVNTRVFDNNPDLADLAADYLPYLQSVTVPNTYPGAANLYIDSERVADTMGDAQAAPLLGYSAVQTMWNHVPAAYLSNEGKFRWRIAGYWSEIESLEPELRTNSDWWKSMMTTEYLGQGGIPEQTFNPFLIGQAAAQTQMGFDLATHFVADQVTGPNTSVYATLVSHGALFVRAQSMVVLDNNQSPWGLTGIPSWTPAPGWAGINSVLSMHADFTIAISAPVVGELPNTSIPAGEYVLCATQGYAPPMTISFNVVSSSGVQSFTNIPVEYVARRKIKFQVPSNAQGGTIHVVSATNAYATWVPAQSVISPTMVIPQY